MLCTKIVYYYCVMNFQLEFEHHFSYFFDLRNQLYIFTISISIFSYEKPVV